ncbi:hypothetical protein U1Q18_050485 [Sarracenia purpurea var. burkii]
MVADQPYIPVRPSSYIYQIDDPSANYIYSARFWDKTDASYAKRSSTSSKPSTPTRHPKSAYSNFYSSAPSFTMAVPMAPVIPQVIHTPVIHRPQWYPSNYENYYVGDVYTTPYEFSGTACTFPVHGGGDATKIQNNTDNDEHDDVDVNIPTKIQIKKPIRTNLTEINIDPITEAKNAFGGRSRTFRVNVDSNVIHKQRPSHYNTYDVIHHKVQLPDQK